MKILVGSRNPVKIEAVEEAFGIYFDDVDVTGISVDSSVPDQPVGDETYRGARIRASHLMERNVEQNLDADYFVGIEGGIEEKEGRWYSFGAICIMDVFGQAGYGTSIHFELPRVVIRNIQNGKELGDVIDAVSGGENTKQKGGAIHYLTKGVIDRKSIYVQGLIAALIPFVNREVWIGQLE